MGRVLGKFHLSEKRRSLPNGKNRDVTVWYDTTFLAVVKDSGKYLCNCVIRQRHVTHKPVVKRGSDVVQKIDPVTAPRIIGGRSTPFMMTLVACASAR